MSDSPFEMGPRRARYAVPSVPCACCGIRVRFRPAQRRVCPRCEMHHGSTGRQLQKRDEEHRDMWSAHFRRQSEEIAGLTQQLVDLQRSSREREAALAQRADDAEYALRSGRVTEAVAARIESANVREAKEETERAYRSRDHLAGALLEISDLHNDFDGDDLCECGTVLDKCTVGSAVGREAGFLIQWENNQIKRAREGLKNGLPPSHPDYRFA